MDASVSTDTLATKSTGIRRSVLTPAVAAAVSAETLAAKATAIRRSILTTAAAAGTGHIATSLSMVDILTVLFFDTMRFTPANEPLDDLVVSKGHGGLAIYAALHARGLLSDDDLRSYHRSGSRMTSFPGEPFFPGLAFASGSLGHGASTACGIALARRHDGVDRRVFTVLSDGECQEGAVWEAALFAAQHRLNNLTFIVDDNKLQAIGLTDEILSLKPFAAKWRAFGFDTVECPGHDFGALQEALRAPSDRPRAIIADTIKGKGVSFMEGDIDWHYLPVKGHDLSRALAELAP